MPGPGQLGALFVVAGAALVGAVHALLPDHWIPFVVLSKARNWDIPRSLRAVVAGGVAHLASTAALGLLIAYLGAGALEKVGHTAELAGAGVLVVFGAVLTWRGVRTARAAAAADGTADHGPPVRPGHRCGPGHRHAVGQGRDRPAASDRSHILQGAILGLRPCAEAIPIFLAAATFGLTPSLVAVAVWVAVTLGAMVAVVWLSLLGLRGLRPERLARYGELVAGAVILAMGLGAAGLCLLH